MLLAINGAPGVGKSTLAGKYANDVPLALIVEIDALRTQIGGWAEREDSRLVARDLALALMRSHLSNGYTVVVPQFLGRLDYLVAMQRLAEEVNTPCVEACLVCDSDVLIDRFRRRRREHLLAVVEHPESDLGDDAVVTELSRINDQLTRDASGRGAIVVHVGDDAEASYRRLRAALDEK